MRVELEEKNISKVVLNFNKATWISHYKHKLKASLMVQGTHISFAPFIKTSPSHTHTQQKHTN
jgi:hypothetical protein